MKLGLVGGSSQERSKPFDDQRSINVYPVVDEKGAEPTALYGVPGKSLFATAGLGAVRGEYSAANGRAFAVSDSRLFEIAEDGTTTALGSLDSSAGIVTMAENGFQLGMCDGDKIYMFTYATNTFEKVTDPDLPSAGGIDFSAGYFVINENNSGKFYISGLYDGLSWNPLDFATAESSPDKLVRAVNFLGQLGLYGSGTLEIWRNTGDSTFPFQRISGATQVGCSAPYTVINNDTSVYWIGANDQGTGIVYKAAGFSPVRVSTNFIERKLQEVTDQTQLRAFAYQQDGHLFYCITGGTLETTLCLDVSTGVWHERAYLEDTGELTQDLACCSMFAFGKQLVGSRVDGSIYELDQDVYSDAGNPILSKRVFTHLIDEFKRIRFNTLTIYLESGVGLQSGQGSNPLIRLRISQDGGRTWSPYYSAEIGRIGRYQQQVAFRRLGISSVMTFELSMTDPVKRAWIGAYLS